MHNRDSETIYNIGGDFGTIVGAFLKKKRINKSRLALEREQKKKTDAMISQKSNYLKMQLGPDDTDLYNQLTENPTPEALALAEPEVMRRSKSRADQAKVDAEAKKATEEQTKAAETLDRQTNILRKQLDLNQDMPPQEKQKVEVFLDGTPEGLKAAQSQFSSWKPEKVEKQSIAEQKAAVMDDLLSLGDNDLSRGLEMARTDHADLYRAALKFGIKPEKKDDPAAKYIEQIQKDFSEFKGKTVSGALINDDAKLKDFAFKWMEDRKGLIPEEARKAIADKLLPPKEAVRGVYGLDGESSSAPAEDQDGAKAKELSSKLKADPASLTDEELDWLESYRKRQGSATNGQ